MKCGWSTAGREHSPGPERDSERVIYLDTAELKKLTGYCRRSRQRAELDRLGIPYIVNARGDIVVRRDHAEPAVAEPEFGPVA